MNGYHYTYGQNYSSAVGEGIVVTIAMAIFLILLTLVLIFVLMSYIFHSIGLYTIGKRMGKGYPWLAFIPYAREYYQGELAGEIRLKNKAIRNPGLWNLLIPIISGVVIVPFVVIIMIVEGISTISRMPGFGGQAAAGMISLMLYLLLLIVSTVLKAIRAALTALINRQILERFTSGNMAAVHAVLTITIPFYEAFCFFVMRNRSESPDWTEKTE